MKRFIIDGDSSPLRHTMKDVARVGGISLGTVSNVINGLPTVSEEKRQMTLSAMKLLNYSPNVTARALKTNRSFCIGLIVPDIHNPFYSEFARGVEDSVHAMGYKLFLCNSDRNVEKERAYVDALMENMADGLILMKTHLPSSKRTEISGRLSVVLVDICDEEDKTGCDFIRVDDYEGITQALDLLWSYNHRRIVMIAGTQDALSARARVRAFQDFFPARTSSPFGESIHYGSYNWQSGYDCTRKLLDSPEPPTAILAANDLMAIGAIKAVHERGLTVPGDISVMGFDDIDMASLCTPALTTIRQPKYEMGECSAQRLFRRIKSSLSKGPADDGEPNVTILKTELIMRDSVSRCKEKTHMV
jgi:DNA-binding LacI/PurR family transcriptional regulator